MSWLDLSRVRNELFRLRQNVPVRLCVPSRLIAQNAILWLETDEVTRERPLTRRHSSHVVANSATVPGPVRHVSHPPRMRTGHIN